MMTSLQGKTGEEQFVWKTRDSLEDSCTYSNGSEKSPSGWTGLDLTEGIDQCYTFRVISIEMTSKALAQSMIQKEKNSGRRAGPGPNLRHRSSSP